MKPRVLYENQTYRCILTKDDEDNTKPDLRFDKKTTNSLNESVWASLPFDKEPEAALSILQSIARKEFDKFIAEHDPFAD